jgi:hypothetical protein
LALSKLKRLSHGNSGEGADRERQTPIAKSFSARYTLRSEVSGCDADLSVQTGAAERIGDLPLVA